MAWKANGLSRSPLFLINNEGYDPLVQASPVQVWPVQDLGPPILLPSPSCVSNGHGKQRIEINANVILYKRDSAR